MPPVLKQRRVYPAKKMYIHFPSSADMLMFMIFICLRLPIVDEYAVKPEGWLDDEPDMIPDPEVKITIYSVLLFDQKF